MMKFLIFFVTLLFSSSVSGFFGFFIANAQTVNQEISLESARRVTQQIADYLSKIRTMSGDFVQIGPRGETTKGKFYLKRPGKIRFIYETSPLMVVSDGKSLIVYNTQLNTSSLYQLKQTPMYLLLQNHIDLAKHHLLEFIQTAQSIQFVLVDTSPMKGTVKMIVDAKTYDLQQWTMSDRKNSATTVKLSNLQKNITIPDDIFVIDYSKK